MPELSALTGYPYDPYLVFFGDSLMDNGNLYRDLRSGLPTGTLDPLLDILGPNGEFTNGLTFAERVNGLLGVVPGVGISNFAVAGAEAVGKQTIHDLIVEHGLEDKLGSLLSPTVQNHDINLGQQVSNFFSTNLGHSVYNPTAFILIGANDYSGLLTGDPLTAIANALAKIPDVVASIMDAAMTGLGRPFEGDRFTDVIISSLPSASFFPAIADSTPFAREIANTFVDLHNAVLHAGVDGLAAQGYKVHFFDMTTISDAILDDQTSFGLIAPYDLTMIGGDPAQLAQYDADQIAFWDQLHPSAATHGVLAAYTAHVIEGNVTLLGPGADMRILGNADDLVFGVSGNDVILSGLGDDIVFGGSGNDVLLGGGGNDQLVGGTGNDVLIGSSGDDVLAGGQGDDNLLGHSGDDVLIGGLGHDVMRGGDGNDTFIFVDPKLIGGTQGSTTAEIHGGQGFDVLYIVLGDELYSGLADALASTGASAPLATLGISGDGIEDIVVLNGRDSMADAFSGKAWHATADLWGIV